MPTYVCARQMVPHCLTSGNGERGEFCRLCSTPLITSLTSTARRHADIRLCTPDGASLLNQRKRRARRVLSAVQYSLDYVADFHCQTSCRHTLVHARWCLTA